MAWIYLAESVESASHSTNGCDLSPTVKKTDSPNPFFCLECRKENSLEHQSGTTFQLSKELCCQKSTSSLADSLAKTSAAQAMARVWKASEAGFFSRSYGSSKKSGQLSFFSKTCQQSEHVAARRWEKKWPNDGMIVDGKLFQLRKWARPTFEIDGSSLLPTPTASTYGTSQNGTPGDGRESYKGKGKPSLAMMARKNLWPTPRANDAEKRGDFDATNPRNGLPAAVKLWSTPTASEGHKGSPARKYGDGTMTLTAQVGGSLSPMWVEWLMGYAIGHTELRPWATAWFRPKPAKRSKD